MIPSSLPERRSDIWQPQLAPSWAARAGEHVQMVTGTSQGEGRARAEAGAWTAGLTAQSSGRGLTDRGPRPADEEELFSAKKSHH